MNFIYDNLDVPINAAIATLALAVFGLADDYLKTFGALTVGDLAVKMISPTITGFLTPKEVTVLQNSKPQVPKKLSNMRRRTRTPFMPSYF